MTRTKNLLSQAQRELNLERKGREKLEKDLDVVKAQLANIVSSTRVIDSKQNSGGNRVQFQDTFDINYLHNPNIPAARNDPELISFDSIHQVERPHLAHAQQPFRQQQTRAVNSVQRQHGNPWGGRISLRPIYLLRVLPGCLAQLARIKRISGRLFVPGG